MITKDKKISKLLEEFPETLDVLVKLSPHFNKLKNKILRKTLAHRVSVEQAAGIAGVNLVLMLNELNKAIKIDTEYQTTIENEKSEMITTEKPLYLKNIAAEKIVNLDVRPFIEAGKDPFLEIMSVIKLLKQDEVFHLTNSFEPIPLYSVLEKKGFTHWTENNRNVFNVYFYKNDAGNKLLEKNYPAEHKNEEEIENVIEIDVRELPPPEPMMKILENIAGVDEKTVLVVHHHREPLMLYPKLEERGYSAVSNKIDENYYKVIITKKR